MPDEQQRSLSRSLGSAQLHDPTYLRRLMRRGESLVDMGPCRGPSPLYADNADCINGCILGLKLDADDRPIRSSTPCPSCSTHDAPGRILACRVKLLAYVAHGPALAALAGDPWCAALHREGIDLGAWFVTLAGTFGISVARRATLVADWCAAPNGGLLTPDHRARWVLYDLARHELAPWLFHCVTVLASRFHHEDRMLSTKRSNDAAERFIFRAICDDLRAWALGERNELHAPHEKENNDADA